MTSPSFQKIFATVVWDIHTRVDVNKLCKIHKVNPFEFMFWIDSSPVRRAKWVEYHESLEHEELVKQQKRKTDAGY